MSGARSRETFFLCPLSQVPTKGAIPPKQARNTERRK